MRLPKLRKRKDKTLFTPQAVNGLVVEDSKGVPLIKQITRIFKPEIHVRPSNSPSHTTPTRKIIQESVVTSGINISQGFKFQQGAFQEKYAKINNPIFCNGQAHYCKWHPIGHEVRPILS